MVRQLTLTPFPAGDKFDAPPGFRQAVAEEKIKYYFEQSRKCLAKVNMPEERKSVLAAYTDKMMKRKN